MILTALQLLPLAIPSTAEGVWYLGPVPLRAYALCIIVGVVAAHDRAIQLLPKKHQLTGQLPLLFVMILFSAGGLYLLFAA